MKTIYTIYCVLIALAALSTPALAEYDIAGDVNNDGRIATADSLLALRMAASSIAPEMERADVNADGMVNSLDACMIRTVAQQTQVCVNSPEVVSGTFEVTIDIRNVTDLDSGQFDLSFDPGVVNVTTVHDGHIAGTTVLIESWDFVDTGTVRVLFNIQGVAGVSGSGQIAMISFEVTGLQGDACVLDISDGGLADTGAEEIPAIWNDCEVTVGGHTPVNRVHNINTGEDFSFIQAAIDDSDTSDGHIIEVGDGVYHETVKVTKSLTIRSENGSANCIVQDAGGDCVVEITVDYASINGFTMTRSPESAFGGAGICLTASYCNVSNNNCSNNNIGIHLYASSNNSISSNNCSNNHGGGICLYGSSNNRLTGNNMFKNGIVIGGDSLDDYTHEIDESNTVNGKPVYYWKDVESGRIPDGAGQVILVNCKDSLVEDQELNNANVGVDVVFSTNITIRNNNCSNNRYDGIRLHSSSNNTISSNNCSNNWYGIHLDDSSNNIISGNDCSNNWRDGIRLHGSSNNIISGNDCSNNRQVGIQLSRSRSNIVSLNNFINNADNIDSRSSTNIWNSTSKINYTYEGRTFTNYLGNYWDDYSGTDTDNDGIGESPYDIDSDRDDCPLVMPIENYSVGTENISEHRRYAQ
jgi:parallel beta-helix repeat protein